MISANGNRVEFRCEVRTKLEGVDHQAHGRSGRIDVFLLRDVFLQDVVLNCPRNFLPIGALLLRDHEIHCPQYRGRRIDGHRDRGLLEIDAVEEDLHILKRIDGDAAFAKFDFALHRIGIESHERRQIEGDRESAASVRK